MQESNEETYDFGVLAGTLRRHAGLIVAVAITLAAIAAALTAVRPDRYQSTAVLLFRDSGLDPQILGRPNLFGGQQILGADTNAGLASLGIVSERASERLAQDGVASVASADEVEVREGAGPELVELTAATERAADSPLVANAYAEAFIGLRRESDRAAFELAREQIANRLAGPGKLDAQTATRLRSLLADLRALELLQTGDVELVERADEPTAQSGAAPTRNAVLGGFAGLVIGIALALLAESFRPRLRSSRDFEAAFGAPVVGTFERAELVDPTTTGAQEALTRLSFASGEPRTGAWLLTSSLESAVDHGGAALGLALAAADRGRRVTLVEAELATPKLAGRLEVEPAPGLADLLAGGADGQSVRRTVDRGRAGVPFILIPAGTPNPNPVRLLGDPRMRELLVAMRDEGELVLVSGPRIGSGAEIVPLGAAVDGVILAISDDPPAAEVELIRSELSRLPVPLLGIVVVSGRVERADPGRAPA